MMRPAVRAFAALAMLSLASCVGRVEHEGFCVNVKTGERIVVAKDSDAGFGRGNWWFSGKDKDGFTRTITSQNVGDWKCKETGHD